MIYKTVLNKYTANKWIKLREKSSIKMSLVLWEFYKINATIYLLTIKILSLNKLDNYLMIIG